MSNQDAHAVDACHATSAPAPAFSAETARAKHLRPSSAATLAADTTRDRAAIRSTLKARTTRSLSPELDGIRDEVAERMGITRQRIGEALDPASDQKMPIDFLLVVGDRKFEAMVVALRAERARVK